MIVLQETNSNQNIHFIPNGDNYNVVEVTDEQTNTTATVSIVSSTSISYYHRITALFTLKENHSYTLRIKNNTTVVYEDKIFCTNQTIESYKVNDATERNTTNDFIVYE